MRISSINIAQPRNVHYNVRKNNVHTNQMQAQQTNFKGWKAGAASVGGSILGVVAGTFLSGGLLAPLLLASAGSVVGGIYGSSKEDNSDYDSDYEPVYP